MSTIEQISKDDILQEAIANGIISLEQLEKQVLDMKRNEYLSKHPYSIWQNKEGIWMTHIVDEDGKRHLRKRRTRKEIEDLIIDYYQPHKEKVRMDDVFREWSERKLGFGEIEKQSYDKYCTEYRRFFKPTDAICKKKFSNITEMELEDFIKTKISTMGLTRKSYSNLSLLLRGMFKYAKKMNYTTISITQFMGDLDLPKGIFKKMYHPRESQVFDEDEIPMVTNYLKENVDIWNMGLLLMFQTGMRVGELSALRKEDVKEDVITVTRTERKFRDENGVWKVEVNNFPKTEAGCRDVVLPPTAKWTLERILELNPDGEYLFMNNGIRIRENTFNKRIETVCKKLEIPVRSSHKIRKTYGTTLIDNNVSDSFVAQQMGHSDITTTKTYYYYSNKNRKTKMDQIANAVTF